MTRKHTPSAQPEPTTKTSANQQDTYDRPITAWQSPATNSAPHQNRRSWPTLLMVALLHLALLGLLLMHAYRLQLHNAQNHQITRYVHLVKQLPTTHLSTHPPQQLTPQQLRHLVALRYAKSLHIGQAFHAYQGVTGFVVNPLSAPEAKSILYANNQGHYFFIGNLLSASGENLSLAQSQHYIHDPQQGRIAAQLQKLPGIIQGNPAAAHLLTIVIDPNSPLFSLQYNNLSSEISDASCPANKAFAIKWILLDYLKPLGPHTAEIILAAKNPAGALANWAQRQHKHLTPTTNHILQHTTQSEANLIAANKQAYNDSQSIHAAQQQLRTNWNSMQQLQLFSFPLSIFKTTQHAYVVQGFVMDEILEKVIPQMKNT